MTLEQKGQYIVVPIIIEGTPISHLLYVDELLLLSEASISFARILDVIMDYYSWTSIGSMLLNHPTFLAGPLTTRRRIASVYYLGVHLVTRKLVKIDFIDLL